MAGSPHISGGRNRALGRLRPEAPSCSRPVQNPEAPPGVSRGSPRDLTDAALTDISPSLVTRDLLPARPSPAQKGPPCPTSSTASATSPAATRGGSSPPGSVARRRGLHAQLLASAVSSTRASACPASESQRAADAIQDRFPQETLYSSNVIFHSEEGLTAPATKAAVEQAVEKLADGPHVIAVSEPLRPARTDRQ